MPKIRKDQLASTGGTDGQTLAVSSDTFVFVDGGAGSQTLAQTLGFGIITGSHNIEITDGDLIKGTDAAPSTDDSGGDIEIVAGLKDGTGNNGIISLDGSKTSFLLNHTEEVQINSATYNASPITGVILKNHEACIYAPGQDESSSGNNITIAAGDGGQNGGELRIYSGAGITGQGGDIIFNALGGYTG